MKNVNQLSNAEHERLALLAEELAESIQVIGKILRHGFESRHPLIENAETNRKLLEKELGDVLHAIDRMCSAGDLSKESIDKNSTMKALSVVKWLHHQA